MTIRAADRALQHTVAQREHQLKTLLAALGAELPPGKTTFSAKLCVAYTGGKNVTLFAEFVAMAVKLCTLPNKQRLGVVHTDFADEQYRLNLLIALVYHHRAALGRGLGSWQVNLAAQVKYLFFWKPTPWPPQRDPSPELENWERQCRGRSRRCGGTPAQDCHFNCCCYCCPGPCARHDQ